MDGSLENAPALLEGPVRVFWPVSFFLPPELRQTFPGLLRCPLRTGGDYSFFEIIACLLARLCPGCRERRGPSSKAPASLPRGPLRDIAPRMI